MMTEAQAKTKACPYAATFAASQQIADGPGPHCVGSGCMAWRWQSRSWQIVSTPQLEAEGWHRVEPDYLGIGVTWRRQTPAEPEGFCGLAGEAMRHDLSEVHPEGH